MSQQQLSKREGAPAPATRSPEARPVFAPRVDIWETGTDVLLTADMPGVDETSVHVDVEGDTLTLSGSLVSDPSAGLSPTYRERPSGNYERAFTLGTEIDRGGIQAKVKDGVLRLVLPKAKESRAKHIEVLAG